MATGNFINRLQENSTADVPEVGQGCTLYYYSDRDAATVIEVKSPSRVVVQEDDVIYNENGYAESISRNSEGKVFEVIRTKKGWKVLNLNVRVRFGFRKPYLDPSF